MCESALTPTVVARLEALRGEPNQCWEWTGGLNGFGYGLVRARTGTTWSTRGAHTLAHWLWKGPVPKGLCVCHTCDNRKCLNPAHMWLGTRADNNRDCVAKGRNRPHGKLPKALRYSEAAE